MSIIHGDCLVEMSGLGDDSVSLVLTDIPYGVVNRASGWAKSRFTLDMGKADVVTFNLEDFVDACCRICSGSIYIFCSTEQVSSIRSSLVRNGLSTRLCIWQKSNPSPMNGQHIWLSGVECCVYGKYAGATFNEHCKNTVWKYPVGRNRLHPTQKPRALFEYLIGASSNKGDLVLDPCAGSGTTGVACQNLGREYILIEKELEYYQICLDRLKGQELE